MSKAKMALANA
jgi:hypothetical protein